MRLLAHEYSNARKAGVMVAVLILASILPLFSQNSPDAARTTRDTLAALNQIDTFTPNDSFAPASPADEDLGEQLLLTRSRSYLPFNIGAGYSTTWTSNAFYTPDSPSSDVIMSAYAEFLALPHLGNNFFFEAASSIRGFRYFRNPILDFNSVDASAGILKVFREFWDVGLYGRYKYSFLFEPGGGEILHEHSLIVGARKTFQFSRANALFLAAEADFAVGGEPGFALANEFSLFAAHQLDWSRWFNTSLFYQMAVYDFRYGGRADLRNTLGVSASIRPLKWFSITGSGWLGWNASNESEYDFFVGNVGGVVTASMSF